MGSVKPGGPFVLFDKSRLMLVPGVSSPFLNSTTRSLQHYTTHNPSLTVVFKLTDIYHSARCRQKIGHTIESIRIQAGSKSRICERSALGKHIICGVYASADMVWSPGYIKKEDKSRIQVAEIIFLRRMKNCTRRDLIKNVNIHEGLDIQINYKIEESKENWKHLTKMHSERIPLMV